MPTSSEWTSADGAPQNWKTPEDAYNSVLKLHKAGNLTTGGTLSSRGTEGNYWSSNRYIPNYSFGYRYSIGGTVNYALKATAYPVRCLRDTLEISLPAISNVEIVPGTMTDTTVTCTASVTMSGGSEITERGICWNKSGTPSISDNKIVSGKGLGLYTTILRDLDEGPTYYVRAYAINKEGISYSKEVTSFKICPSEFEVIHAVGFNGAPETKTVTYHSVSTMISGAPRCWLTQNLGADSIANSVNDSRMESSGWYFQFNRSQGYKHDGTTRTPSLSPWITGISENKDWEPSNDPCRLLLGLGWRLPTSSEWTSADGAPQNWQTPEDAYNSVLKLHKAGNLTTGGTLSSRGTEGNYWSSNRYIPNVSYGYRYSIGGTVNYALKATAYPVRCLLDTHEPLLSFVSNVEIIPETMTETDVQLKAVIFSSGEVLL